MIRWFRVILPPWGTLAGLAILYAGLGAFELYFERKVGQPLPTMSPPSLLVLLFGVVIYSLFRVFSFHPVRRPAYKAWLETTPWTSQKPLPLGPIHLVGQDVAMIGLAVAAAWPLHHYKALWIVQAFLASYLFAVSLALWWTGEKLSAFGVWFGLGSMIYTCESFAVFALVAAYTYGLAYWGLRQSLARFPWTLSDWVRITQGNEPLQHPQNWPFDRLAPKFIPDLGISIQMGILTSFLIPWWYYVLSFLVKGPDKFEAALCFYWFVTIPMVGMRFLIYRAGYMPPISFLGRIATGRWVIPGYDQVFVAPLMALIIVFWLPRILSGQGFGFVESHAISLVWVFFLILILGPSLKAWRLTGNHRIAPPSIKSAPYVRVG